MQNFNKILKSTVVLCVLLAGQVKADEQKLSFTSILNTLSRSSNVTAEIPKLDLLNAATTEKQAGSIVKSIQYSELVKQDHKMVSADKASQFETIMGSKPLTIIVVPGLLAEFIETKAFEDLFSKNTSYKKIWQELAAKSKVTDPRLNLEKFAYENKPIGEEISAASIDDANGKPLVKVIILTAGLGSTESIGDDVATATIFNRRLEKYAQITGDSNFIMVGYSRGTPLSLEMITQAEKQNLSYVKNVKGMVSYAGVVMGSALANVTGDLSTSNGKLFAAAKKLSDSLQTSTGGIDEFFKARSNTQAFEEFTRTYVQTSLESAPAFSLKGLQQQLSEQMQTANQGDFRSTAKLIFGMSDKLNGNGITDFNGHVNRLKFFINAMLTAVSQLRSDYITKWWQTHTLPKHINYYSISAVMADETNSEIEKALIAAKAGYNETIDDKSLLKNKKEYQQASGFALNDSQVALHESQFLPGVLAGLNANNAGVNIQSLGVLQTHHWGASLRIVNTMKDGRLNPFPRENVLKALAIYFNQ